MTSLASDIRHPDSLSTHRLMKGIGFTNATRFVVERYGTPALQEVREAMSAPDLQELSAVVPVGWYDVYLFARYLRTIDRVCGEGDLKLCRAVGEFEAEQDFNRAVRWLMRVISPEYVFKTHQRLWSHFQNTGDWVLEKRSYGMSATLNDWAVDPCLCHEVTGYLARLIEFTGGQRVAVEHPSCRAREGERCIYKIRYA